MEQAAQVMSMVIWVVIAIVIIILLFRHG